MSSEIANVEVVLIGRMPDGSPRYKVSFEMSLVDTSRQPALPCDQATADTPCSAT